MLKHFVEMLTEKISIEASNSTDEILARLKREGSLADFERLEKKTAAGKCRFFSGVLFLYCLSTSKKIISSIKSMCPLSCPLY